MRYINKILAIYQTLWLTDFYLCLGNYANYDVIFPRCSSSVVECLRSLACSCLKDVDVPFTLSAMKVI